MFFGFFFFLLKEDVFVWFKHIYFRNVYIYNTYKSITIGLERKHKSLFSSFPNVFISARARTLVAPCIDVTVNYNCTVKLAFSNDLLTSGCSADSNLRLL